MSMRLVRIVCVQKFGGPMARLTARQLSLAACCAGSRRSSVATPFVPKSKPQLPRVPVWEGITIGELAESCGKKVNAIIDVLGELDLQRQYQYAKDPLDKKDVKEILTFFRMRPFLAPPPISLRIEKSKAEFLKKDAVRQPPAPPEKLKPRRPVVTIMGHVDHGKTTLLDTLRKSRVVDQEFGGITQHIGAFTVNVPQCGQGAVTFLDTPGHAAFSAMRARGANVTDIVVLVVAADDGVMEQTVESIKYANSAGVPMIVAMNKMDKPGVKPEKTKQGLLEYGIQSEDSGGDSQFVEISAKTGQGVDDLLEAIAMQGEMLNLSATTEGLCEGYVIESSSDPHLGKVSTILIQRGELRKGSVLVAGSAWGRVRTMTDDSRQSLKTVAPGCAAQITGWKDLPSAGDLVLEVENEKRAKEVVEVRIKCEENERMLEDAKMIEQKNDRHRLQYRAALEDRWSRGKRIKERPKEARQKMYVDDDHPVLSVLVKGDTDGSVEAVTNILMGYDKDDECRLDIIDFGVGPVTLSDIEMARSFNGVIYAVHVDVLPEARAVAGDLKIKKHRVIYHLIDDVKEELSKRLPLKDHEEIIGEGEVIQQFLITDRRQEVPVAGSKCTDGEFRIQDLFRFERNGEILFEGKLSSLKHLKNEAKVIQANKECGIRLPDTDVRFEAGDKITCLRKSKVETTSSWNPRGF